MTWQSSFSDEARHVTVQRWTQQNFVWFEQRQKIDCLPQGRYIFLIMMSSIFFRTTIDRHKQKIRCTKNSDLSVFHCFQRTNSRFFIVYRHTYTQSNEFFDEFQSDSVWVTTTILSFAIFIYIFYACRYWIEMKI